MKSYTIGEVSELVGVKPHVIRYWEEEIPFLAPRKDNLGRRVYADRELQMLLRVKYLLYEERYTVEGARERLWSELTRKGADAKGRIAEIRTDLIKVLKTVRRKEGGA